MEAGYTDEEKEQMHKARKLQIARALLETVEFPKVKGQAKVRSNIPATEKEARMQRTLKLISNPKYQNLYSMDLERRLMTETSMNQIIVELQKMADRNASMKILALTLQKALKVS